MAGGTGVVVYDLSSSAGYAVYHPDLDEPVFGTCYLPSPTTDGSSGPAWLLLYNHIAWVNRNWPLAHIGFEQFLAPTGGKRDQKDAEGKAAFVTSPKTLKRQIGTIAITELCAEMLEIPVHSIHNASWRKYWLGNQRRGTDRDAFKAMSVAKAKGLGWNVKNDDEADALGQLHHLLAKLNIKVRWGRNISRDLYNLHFEKGVPPHV